MSTMIRSRGGPNEALTPSTHQYEPAPLLHQDGSLAAVGAIPERAAVIRYLMPPAYHAGWDILCSGRRRGPQEALARVTCEWIDSAGPGLGFRVPSVEERSRALGWNPT
eukprot:15455099-Alexandrium_andersonii.AAC.1